MLHRRALAPTQALTSNAKLAPVAFRAVSVVTGRRSSSSSSSSNGGAIWSAAERAATAATAAPLRSRCIAHAKKQAASAAAPAAGTGSDELDKVAREVQADAEERMKRAVDVVSENFNTMRTGRANPAILDKIIVDYYGTPTPLKSLASVSVPDASTLLVAPYDRGGLRDVEKAILESDIGINPSNDGEKIRLVVPPMTQERRKELTKKVSKMGEDGKVAVRNVRKDAMKRLDKHEFPKDARKALDDGVQKLTDRFVKAIDDAAKAKSEELMKV